MPSHEFMLKLNREVTDEEIEALYDAGCSDAGIETGPLGTLMDFTRTAPSLAEALVSAVRDIEKVEGLRVMGVKCASMVTLAQIAERVGVTREAVRLWSIGQRGSGGFPYPVIWTPSGEKLWDWAPVAQWLLHNHISDQLPEWTMRLASARERTLCAADRALAARAALGSVPEETREELESLLQDA
jgi:hypothetical protein